MENPMDQGAWWPAVYGVTQSRTRLKWLSSSTCLQSNAQNSPSQASTVCELWTSKCSSWFYERQRNQRSNCQHPLDHRKSNRVPEKHLFLFYWLCQSLWLCGSQQTVEILERDRNTRPPYLPGWMKHKLESRIPGEISITSDMQMTPPLWQKMKRN